MTAPHLVACAMAALGVGAVFAFLAGRSKPVAGAIAFLATLVAAGFASAAALAVLRHGPDPTLTLLATPSLGSSLRLHVDGLSAVFAGIIALVSTLAALYSIPYMDHYKDYGVTLYYPCLLLFVAGMYGVVTCTDLMLFFCAFWQLMTLPSYLLVRYESREKPNVRAANRYLVLMEIACMFVMLAAGLLADAPVLRANGEVLPVYDFDALAHAMPGMLGGHAVTASLGLLLLLCGFGIKAGMWPFGQFWLPDAHPAAPSPVSALLSGVMIKTGVYGLMRTFLWMVPVAALPDYASGGWGLLIAALGTITLFVGTLQALKQTTTKRLLAFSSIGQVGYILLGLGACVALIKPGQADPAVRVLATIAFCGALFHTVNHACFKSLLFLSAGALLKSTGTQDLGRLGGLIRHMPVTAAGTLIASAAIAGVPLSSGFASKWCLYVAALLSGRAEPGLALAAVVAILTSALTLACFVSFFGAAFLARPSRLVNERASAGPLESDRLMLLPQLALALVTLGLGLFPMRVLQLIQRALLAGPDGLASLLTSPVARAHIARCPYICLETAGAQALLAPLVIGALLVPLLALAYGILRLGGVARRASEPWLCGYAREHESNRYGARHLYGEFKKLFDWVGGDPRPDGDPHA